MSQKTTERSRSPHYGPSTLARKGGLEALRDLSELERKGFAPIFIIPARTWDCYKGDREKSMAQDLAPVPKNLVSARKRAEAFVDVFLLDDERLIQGIFEPANLAGPERRFARLHSDLCHNTGQLTRPRGGHSSSEPGRWPVFGAVALLTAG